MISLLLFLVVVGVLLYLLNAYVPMAAPIKTVINVIVVLAVIVYVLQAFGLVKDTREAKKTDTLADLAERLKACEAWQAARDLERKVDAARAEGAREAREATGRHPRSKP